MNPKTKEWIEKAEGDWATMTREYAVTKAELRRRLFPRTTMRGKILKGLYVPSWSLAPDFSKLEDGAIILTSLVVEIRYPGMQAIKIDAKRAIKNCTLFRTQFRSAFELPDGI